MVEQGQHLLRVLLRKPEDGLAFQHALRLDVGRLHHELVDGRADQFRRLFQRVAHTIRDAGGEPAAREVQCLCHVQTVPLWHRTVNALFHLCYNSGESGFKASRHYLAGSSPTRLPANASSWFDYTPELQKGFGVAAGLGTMNQHDHILIGERHGWGEPATFGMAATDRRQHLYIIGKTGSGKTTLLHNLIVQHLAAGHGIGLIDPHGDLAEELLDHIPPWRADHLTYFHPGDLEFPIGLNLLANVPKDERHLVASGIVGAFKSLWRDSWGPRMEYLLYNATTELLDCQNTTLLGVNRLLTDDEYRAWLRGCGRRRRHLRGAG